MILPCQHNSEDFQSSCRICYLFATRPDYAKIFRARIIRQAKAAFRKPCVYLGELVNPKPACGCGALHKCEKYGEAVLTGAHNKYRVCSQCNDYEARESS